MCRNHAHSPLGIVCHRLQNLWFRKKASYSRGATPEKMVAIFTAAASLSLFPSVSFCFFILSFLSQHLDCSISHWIILGRTRKQASGGEIKQPLADPTRLQLGSGGMEEKRRESQGNLSFLPKGSRTMLSESENGAPMSKEGRPVYYATLEL